MASMWHLWLGEGGFKKEIHMCAGCGKGYGLFPSLEELRELVDVLDEAIDDGF